jgi:hypothetical protein
VRMRDRLDDDTTLRGLVLDRQRLLRQLGPALRRVGASNPHRTKINARLAVTRKRLRKELRANAEAIASRLLELSDLDLSS